MFHRRERKAAQLAKLISICSRKWSHLKVCRGYLYAPAVAFCVWNLSNSYVYSLLLGQVEWSTWGSKLESIFLPVFSTLPNLVVSAFAVVDVSKLTAYIPVYCVERSVWSPRSCSSCNSIHVFCVFFVNFLVYTGLTSGDDRGYPRADPPARGSHQVGAVPLERQLVLRRHRYVQCTACCLS